MIMQASKKIHSGTLKKKEREDVANPVKQHKKKLLTVKIVREREHEERTARRNTVRVFEKASPAESRRRLQKNTVWSLLWFQPPFLLNIAGLSAMSAERPAEVPKVEVP